MRVMMPLFVTVVMAIASGCSSDAAGVTSPPSPPGAEACPQTFNACVELCQPMGVLSFGCWSEKQGVDFRCECLDGSTPAEPSSDLQIGGPARATAKPPDLTGRMLDDINRCQG